MTAHRIRAAFVWIVLASLTGCAPGPRPAPMAGWDVVVAPDAAPAVQYAAEEFQRFFAEATGETLPITTTPNRPGRHVFIRVETADLGEEDLRILIREDNIAIAGGSPRGALYGVYAFLEDQLGVRFLTPDHTHVPKADPSWAPAPGSVTFRPVLAYRHSYYGANHADHAFAARMRNNAIPTEERLGAQVPWQLINHTVYQWVPVEKYGKEHPEWFAEEGDDPQIQPCLTNPEVKRLITEGVLAQLKRELWRVNISVSQNDNHPPCKCPDCRAIDEKEASPMGSLLTLVNEVADAVAKEHPGVQVGTLAYQYSRKPPKHLKPRDNVAIQLCSIEACMIHPINDPDCPRNVAFCKDLEAWGKITPNIHIWNYNVSFISYLTPCPNLRVIGPNIRFFVANHAKGLLMQAAYDAQATELADLRNYLISNLMWDPARDEKKLMEEFLTLHYGKAAGPIREYVNLIHDNAEAKGIHHHCFGGPRDYGIDEEILAKGKALFAEALTQAGDDTIRQRVEKASIPLARVEIEPVVQWMGKHMKGEEAEVLPEELAALRPQVRRFFALCRKHGVNRASEGRPLENAEAMFRKAFGLGPDEVF